MNIDDIRNYCLNLPGVYEDMPFGIDNLVFKVGSRMFLLMELDNDPLTINVKCDPIKALDLRERFPMNVKPGYHMNKKHWNTIIINSHLKQQQIQEWIDHSYILVFQKLKKSEQKEIHESE